MAVMVKEALSKLLKKSQDGAKKVFGRNMFCAKISLVGLLLKICKGSHAVARTYSVACVC